MAQSRSAGSSTVLAASVKGHNLAMPKISAASIGEHRELRRGQLISAAMELALTQGAQAVTVSAVAAKAGLARTSIYEYFASSADLVADLVIDELSTYAHRLSDAIKDVDDPYEKIERWIAEGLRYVADGRHMLVKSLNTISTPEDRKEEISQGHRRLMAPIRQALSETGIKDLSSASAMLQAVTDAASIRIDAGNEAELEIQAAVRFATAGLRALA